MFSASFRFSYRIIRGLTVGSLAIVLSSCASSRTLPPPVLPSGPGIAAPLPPISGTPMVLMPPTPGTMTRMDIVHTIGPGETLWRIGKMYDVPIDAIKSANHISDAGQVELGTRLKIPNAAPIKPVIALYPSHKWKYIIIHHSATKEGNSLSINAAHLRKGWDRGVGYHFVIDNGSVGKQDGQIEATPRWVKQLDGAHCKVAEMNTKAIGICLVGNFNEGQPSSKQFESLVYLVQTLIHYYHIPADHIIGHGHVKGAKTDCPGSHFPMSDLKQRLN